MNFVFTFIALCFSTFVLAANGEYADAFEEGTPCNPRLERTCFSVNQALGTSVFESFASMPKLFSSNNCPQNIECLPEYGLKLSIKERFEYPSIKSNFYLLYGKVSAEIRSSHGAGIVTSLYLQSDDLDEIDVMESIGNDFQNIQTNYFVKGNTSDYERGTYHTLKEGASQEHYNRYGVEWTPEKIKWFVNNELIREVEPNPKDGYPTSPMYIVFSIWIGGDLTNEPGTISWSGGLTNSQDLPFDMYIRNVEVSDYSSGDHYVYGNVEGRWLSLNSRGGEIFGHEPTSEVLTDFSEEQLRVYEAYEMKKNGDSEGEESDEGESEDETEGETESETEGETESETEGETEAETEGEEVTTNTDRIAYNTHELNELKFIQFAASYTSNTGTSTTLNPYALLLLLLLI